MWRKEKLSLVEIFFIILAISVFRRMDMILFPGDIFGVVFVYAVYFWVLFFWRHQIHISLIQDHLRGFLLSEWGMMVTWILVRLLQDTILYKDVLIMRLSGYLICIPAIGLPLSGYYASLGLGKEDTYKINKRYYYLLIPSAILSIAMLTNEFHHLVFVRYPGEGINLEFHPGILFYVIIAWIAFFVLARFKVIYDCCRERFPDVGLSKKPFLVASAFPVVVAYYAVQSFSVKYEIIEFSVLVFMIEVLLWSSVVMTGMIPINSQYETVFDLSTVAMRIMDHKGHTIIRSSCAGAITSEQFDRLVSDKRLDLGGGKELCSEEMNGGYIIWENDYTKAKEATETLRQTEEELQSDVSLVEHELQTKSSKVRVEEEDRLITEVTEEIADRTALIRRLLDDIDNAPDKKLIFRIISLIGVYIKRHCAVSLLMKSGAEVPFYDIRLFWEDMERAMEKIGYNVTLVFDTETISDPKVHLECIERFEATLEKNDFYPGNVLITVTESGAKAVFS